MFAAACWYTGYIMASSRIVRNVDSLTSITVVMLGAAVAHVLILAFSDSHLPTDGKGWLAALGAAVFSTVIAMGFFFAGVKIVGVDFETGQGVSAGVGREHQILVHLIGVHFDRAASGGDDALIDRVRVVLHRALVEIGRASCRERV